MTLQNSPEVKAVTESVRYFQSAYNNARLYHNEHPKSLEPLQRFVDCINALTTQIGPVLLQAGFDGIRYANSEITKESDDNKGLGYLLHQEGIASLVFKQGMSLTEASTMLGIIQTNFTVNFEDTLESLLWEAELPSIDIRAFKALDKAESLSGLDQKSLDKLESLNQQINRYVEFDQHDQTRNFKVIASKDKRRQGSEGHLFGPERDGDIYENKIQEDEEAELLGHLDNVNQLTGRKKTLNYKERFLSEYFGDNFNEELESVQVMAQSIADESDIDIIIRAIKLLLLSGVAQRREFPPRTAKRIAAEAMEVVYAENDMCTIQGILKETRKISRKASSDSAAQRFIREVFDEVLPDFRIASLLVNVDYANDSQRIAAEKLIADLPNEGLLAMLEWSAPRSFNDLTAFYNTFTHVAGRRIANIVHSNGIDDFNDQILISLIRVFRVLGDSRLLSIRPELARHRSLKVRHNAINWFADTELSEDDARILNNSLFDTDISVQKAVLDVLAQQQPIFMRQTIEQQLDSERFMRFTAAQKETLCLAYAMIAQERSLVLLERIFKQKIPLLNKDPTILDAIEAAAKAILAIGSERALTILKRETAAWVFGPRKKSAKDFLRCNHDISAIIFYR